MSSYSWALFIIPSTVWILWRVWTFTVRPKLNPQDPRLLPYAIPYLGSALSFFHNSHSLINHGLQGLRGQDRDIFAVALPGDLFYIITNPKHVSEIYKNTTTLSFDAFVEDITFTCGGTKRSISKQSLQPPPYVEGAQTTGLNLEEKSMFSLSLDLHHAQLLPGPGSHFKPLMTRIFQEIRHRLSWEKILEDGMTRSKRSLLELTYSVLVEAGTTAYFGSRLLSLSPDITVQLQRFDSSVWKLLFHYPKLFSRDAISSRDHIIDALTEYFKLPRKERDDASWFTYSQEAEFRAIGLSERDVAASMLLVLFVANTNGYKLCFWMLSHILERPALMSSIKQELEKCPVVDDGPSIEHLTEECPVLNAVLQESLRVYSGSASTRFINDDTMVAGKLLRKGKKILIPYRQLHEDPGAWGSDAHLFRPERWLENKTLKRSSSFRPFGGGATYCAGRIVAQQSVLYFIGLLLKNFEVELITGGNRETAKQVFPPRKNNVKPSLGMMEPLEGDDPCITIGKKQVQV